MRGILFGAGLLMIAVTADAGILWDNGSFTGNTSLCDTENVACGEGGWSIADNFTLTTPAVITGFTIYDVVSSGAGISDYFGSKWAIYGGDPFTSAPLKPSSFTQRMSSFDAASGSCMGRAAKPAKQPTLIGAAEDRRVRIHQRHEATRLEPQREMRRERNSKTETQGS